MDGRHYMWGGGGGGLEEAAADCRIVWGGGGSKLPFTNFPFGGTSSKLEPEEARYSPAFDSEEEVAILPSGCKRGSSSSKRRGEADGGGE